MREKFKIGVLSSAYIDFDLMTALDHIADAGFHYVEIAAVDGALEHLRQEDMTSSKAAEIRGELEKRGLHACSLAAHTPLDRETSVERELPRLRFAAELGCPVCVGTCGSFGEEEQLKRNINRLVKEAENLGVVLALETNADFISNGRQGINFVKQWDSPYLGITYDAANVYRGMGGSVDVSEDFCSVCSDITHLHMKDLKQEDGRWRFCLPGEGVIPTSEILKELRKRTDEIAINLELPYAYRFDYPGAPLSKDPEQVGIQRIDRDLKEYMQMVQKALH